MEEKHEIKKQYVYPHKYGAAMYGVLCSCGKEFEGDHPDEAKKLFNEHEVKLIKDVKLMGIIVTDDPPNPHCKIIKSEKEKSFDELFPELKDKERYASDEQYYPFISCKREDGRDDSFDKAKESEEERASDAEDWLVFDKADIRKSCLSNQRVKDAKIKIFDKLKNPIVQSDRIINVKVKNSCEYTKGYLEGAYNEIEALLKELGLE